MRSIRGVSLAGGLVLAAVAGAGTAQAGPCATAPSATYTAAGFSCSVSTLTFSNMSILPSTTGDGFFGPITVVPIAGGLQLTFSAGASFPPTSTADLAWTYDVTSTLPITDAGLSLTGSGLRGAHVILSETLEPIALTLSASNPGSPTDHITFPGVTSLSVSKDLANIANTAGIAVSSIIKNTFSTGKPIPEPVSIGLLGMGLLGIGAARWLKRAA